MAARKVTDIIKEIESGKFAPVYLLQGEEPYYVDLISELIPGKALNDGEREFNLTIVYGRDVDMATVLNHARRFPMMAERQVVIVKEAQQITDIGRESGKSLLQAYVENPVPSTVLVICYKNKSMDGRTALPKTIDKNGIVLTTKKLYDNQVPQWIDEYVSSRGARISPKANQLLSEYIGANLERLSNELNKIFINMPDKGVEINDDIIQKFVGINKEYNYFELQRALLMKDRGKVFRITRYMAENQKANPPVLLMYQLYGLYSKLLVASESGGKDLASVLRINPYFAREYQAGLNNYNFGQITRAIAHLHEADGRLKGVNSGTMELTSILNELMYKLLR